jgi:hypothetical protein
VHISFLNYFSFAAIQREIEMVRKMKMDIRREIDRGGDGDR